MKKILDQLARSTLLCDDQMEAAIFGGDPPSMEVIVAEILCNVVLAEAVVRGDEKASWSEKRLARMCLGLAFLGAIACMRDQGTAS